MEMFLKFLHIGVCLFLILVVLLQAGKGGGVGIAFGGGGSQTVFGSSGAGNFLTKLTSVTAGVFLLTSLGLAHYSSQQDSKRLQKLAERKTDEKKGEDARAAKLKEDLDKARASAKKMGAAEANPPAPITSDLPGGAAAVVPAKGAAKAPAAADVKVAPAEGKTTKTKKTAAPTDEAKPEAKPEAKSGDGEAAPVAKPKKKRRAAPAATGAEGTPAEPAEAPAAPTE